MTQNNDVVAGAFAVADSWRELKAIAAEQRAKPLLPTLEMTVALDELLHAVDQLRLATQPTERVEPLPDLMTVRITGGPSMGLTGVIVMRHTHAVYEVEVFDGAGASLGTSAIERQYLEPLIEP